MHISSLSEHSLRISEIFHSIQGESSFVGRSTIFIRLTGCPLRCVYCDTEYAFSGGKMMSITEIVEQAKQHGAPYVCVTGGEPLAQPDCGKLCDALLEAGFKVSIETSGAMPIEGLDDRISVVMDLKTPSSGELSKNLYENIAHLQPNDQVKFVVADKKDFDWSVMQIAQHDLLSKVGDVLVSPIFEQCQPKDLAAWVLQSKLDVRMQLQLHKAIWGETPGV